MLFNLKTIIPIYLTLNAAAVVAAPAADAQNDIQVVYKTVTVLDHPVAVPTGLKFAESQFDDDACDDDKVEGSKIVSSSYSVYSGYYQSGSPSSLTTLSTVTTTAASVAEDAEVVTTAQAATTVESTTPTNQGGIFDSSVVHKGIATFYSVSADNCGTTSTDNDFVCAISQPLYNTVANSQSISEYCGHMINVTYGSKTIQVKVVDSCASCDSEHIDLSPAAFNALANPDLGVLDITWSWA